MKLAYPLALLSGLLCMTPACTWSEAQPTLVFQLSRVTHRRSTTEDFGRAQGLVFSAAVSMALERAAVLPVDEGWAGPGRSPEADAFGGVAGEPRTTPESDPSADSAAVSCDQSSLCSWAGAAEESAFASVIELADRQP